MKISGEAHVTALQRSPKGILPMSAVEAERDWDECAIMLKGEGSPDNFHNASAYSFRADSSII